MRKWLFLGICALLTIIGVGTAIATDPADQQWEWNNVEFNYATFPDGFSAHLGSAGGQGQACTGCPDYQQQSQYYGGRVRLELGGGSFVKMYSHANQCQRTGIPPDP